VGILPARPIQIIQIKYTTAYESGNNFKLFFTILRG